MKKILSDVGRFESFFALSENQVSNWVRDERFFKEPPSVAWCTLFSLGFEEPPTSHYRLLLHDLRNHFPKLIDKLRSFESKIKELCPRYSELLYNITKIVYEEAKRITTDMLIRSIVTEVVIMSLAGYDEWSYPNDKRFLEERKIYDNVRRFIAEISSKYHNLTTSFIDVRKEALTIIKDVKEEILRILHIHKLPGRCKLI